MTTARRTFTRSPLLCLLGGLLLSSAAAFVPSFPGAAVPRAATRTTRVASSTSDDDMANMAKILQEEAMNAENLKASAKEMQNLKPGQIDDMIREMDNMPSWQKEQLKKMGMDPEMMKASMQQFKENPELLKNMGQAMENMTPEQLMESSKAAQEQMRAAQQQQQQASTTSAPAVTDAEIVSEDAEDDEDDEEDEDDEPIEPVPEVLDAMYEVAKIMGNGKVTFGSFCTLPVITLLSGNGEDDLDQKELKECWNKGSLGATNLDRAAFERVWREIQDNYYSDIVEEAQLRMPSKKRAKKRGSADKSKSAVATPAPPSPTPTTPMVGASISPEMLKQQVDNISDDDMKAMFESMTNMTPEQEARMKAMGADPAMMKKSAEMMKNNPLLRNAAKAMIKNTPPEQIMKASQEAQERMQNMSEEEKKRLMDGMM